MTTESKIEKVAIQPLSIKRFALRLEGTSPLIQHRFDEESHNAIRRKKEGGKGKMERPPFDPENEALRAAYQLSPGVFGVPVATVKNALHQAAHKDIGIARTQVKPAVFLEADGFDYLNPSPNPLIALDASEPRVREDVVKVPPKRGAADLRYRLQFDEWALDLRGEFNAELIDGDVLVSLFERAGWGIGLHEWRPENGGDYGRFRVVSDDSNMKRKPSRKKGARKAA